jgi:segregation and condensation protein B
VPGRPVVYATTPAFLTHFGLGSRKELPGIDELKAAGLLDPMDYALRRFSDEPNGPDGGDELATLEIGEESG